MKFFDFLKFPIGWLGLLAGISLLTSCGTSTATEIEQAKNWAWITPDLEKTDAQWQAEFQRLKSVGFDAVLLEVYAGNQAYFGSKRLPVKAKWLERMLPLVHGAGLECHAWMWTMPNNNPAYYENHQDWYNVNRKGESSAVAPAYVNYYRFMCPSNPEVQQFILGTVKELCNYDVDGIHFDYIRHPDVILAKGLWKNYGIVQDKEYPQYDYCYCDRCRNKFKEQYGQDPLDMDDPTKNEDWRQFRMDLITHLVNDLFVPEVHQHNKMISAAVFPNWRSVKQDWKTWHMDAVLPMLYNGFYEKPVGWVGEQVAWGVNHLQDKNTQLYSGLFLPDLKKKADFEEAIRTSLSHGAKGVSLFSLGGITESQWEVLEELHKEGTL